MVMLLDLAYIGHSILRKKCLPVHTIDQSILTLIEHMKETVQSYRGLGLAAPQVGVQLTLFLACFPVHNEEGDMVAGPECVYQP